MLDIFTLQEASLRFTKSSSLAYMVTALELFVINRKLFQLDLVISSKHPDSRSSVPDARKYTCPNSGASILTELTLDLVSHMFS